MLTRNFYKCLNAKPYHYLRTKSPNNGTPNYPYIDLINPSGKYICTEDPASQDTNTYDRINVYTSEMRSTEYPNYVIGVGSKNSDKGGTVVSVYSITKQHNVLDWLSSKDVNDGSSYSSYSHDGHGSLIMYIGNGTTVPTQEDYTMESCLTSYDRVAMSVTDITNEGVIIISYSVKPTADISLSEVGIFATACGYGTVQCNPTKDTIMVCHDVFTPVTLPKDKVVTITYTINLSELTAETTIG